MIDDVEQALDHDRAIVPQPAFRRAVMRNVRATAEVPPMALPWRRLVVAIAFALLAAIASLADPAAEMPGTIVLVPAAVLILVAARGTAGVHATHR